tara:strand:- start:1995 stop:2360 length:366 start_codon:yes stop_codon:yes gene_type:complete
MAVSRREKNADANYIGAIGTRSDLGSREPELEDVIEDLRDDMNAMCDLSAINEAKVGITTAQARAITDNTAKRGVTNAQDTLLTMLSAFSFTYTASPDGGRTPAKLTIQHISSRTNFEIDA